MVFFVEARFGGSRMRRIRGVEASCSNNFGNYLYFDVYCAADLTFQFDINLLAPNYVPVTPMPVASIENKFELMLGLGYVMFLVNEGYGYISTSYYRVGLGDQYGFCFLHEVEITNKKAELLNHGCCGGRLPILSPISLLF